MNRKIKFILHSPLIRFFNWRARRIAKKIEKPENEEKYPIQWRSNYVLKKTKLLLKIYNITLNIKGYENLPKAPAVLTPNHASIMDPLVMIASLENPNKNVDNKNGMVIFLAKKELLKKKAIIGYAKIIDTHFIDREKIRDALKIMEDLDNASKKHKKYQVIFPEGSRSKDGKIKDFKSGAFRTAKKSFLPIVPITINNSLSSTNLNRKKNQVIEVIFHPIIKPINFISQETKNIAKTVQKIVESKWTKPEGQRSKVEEKV